MEKTKETKIYKTQPVWFKWILRNFGKEIAVLEIPDSKLTNVFELFGKRYVIEVKVHHYKRESE